MFNLTQIIRLSGAAFFGIGTNLWEVKSSDHLNGYAQSRNALATAPGTIL